MHLLHTHDLLKAAAEKRDGALELRGAQMESEVREMVTCGLLEATFSEGPSECLVSIGRVTEAGKQFLRAFDQHIFPDEPLEVDPKSVQDILSTVRFPPVE